MFFFPIFFYWEGDHFLNPDSSTSLGYSPGLNSPAIQRKWLMFTVVVISNYMHWLMESFFFFLACLFIYFGIRDLSVHCMASLAVIYGHRSSGPCGILVLRPGIQPISQSEFFTPG